MEECEIDRKSSSAADLSFFGMENPMEGTSVSDAVLEHDLEARVSEGVRRDFSGSMESWSGGLGMKMDGGRVSESEAWNEGESGSDSSQMAPYSSSSSREAASANLMHGLQPGDMVWGKVKSHPWWPGHIFNEAFASPSVRRMKREGHMLVAFFGDSSYGWFDHTELIPFEPHFSEKSKQTNSRTFVKAVEEAVDELSRRGALALACRCRNPLNFRQTGVPGYFSVDVAGYEPGGVYSSKQIKKARDDFVPAKALSFVNQLAATPRRSEYSKGIDWIRSMATLLAYRRAVFEEFDETYAQAFGVQPVRPSKNEPGMPDQAGRITPRAPLSGPLVIAEALGGKKSPGKSAPKASKAPSSKKNKYVLKRRDETPITGLPLLDSPTSVQTGGTTARGYHFDLAPGQQPQASVVISSLPAFREAAAAVSSSSPSSSSHIAAHHGDYVLQKRAPAEKPPPPTQALKRHEAGRASGHGDTTDPAWKERAAGPISKMEASDAQGFRTPDKPVAHPAAKPQSVWEDFDDWMLKSQLQPEAHTEKPGRAGRLESTEPTSVAVGFDESKSAVKLDSPVGVVDAGSDVRHDVKPPVDPKDKAGTKTSEVSPGVRSAEGGAGVATVGLEPRHGKPQDSNVLEDDSTNKRSRKRSADDTGDVKKKKKKKKDKAGIERLVIPREEEPNRIKAGKSIGVGLGNAELAQPELQSPYGPTAPPTKLDTETLDLKLPQLVADLSALALDPFHGIERDAPNIVRHVLLRFRSLVYQKSLIALPSGETEEVQAVRPIAVPLAFEPGAGDIASGKGLKVKRELAASSKPSKPTSRPDDQTMIGRKRGPSDRQEEMSAKRIKKLSQVRALPGEKKARIGQKAPEGEQRAPVKPLTAAEPVKKLEPPPVPRIPRPTFLVMKFPPRSTLPSVASLKAKFGRFGTLDLQGTRVFWKSFSCKVLYKYKSDAQAAYNHARNNDLFGQVKVEYALREVEGAPEPLSDLGKRRPDSRADDGALFRQGNRNGGQMSQLGPLLFHQQQRQSSVQLKSILKKPGDETTPPGGGNAKEIPRVKFMLGGDEAQVVAAASNNNNGGVSGNGEPISKNQKSVNFLPPPPPPPPLLPLPNLPPLNPSPSQPSHLVGLQRFPPPRPPLLPYSEPPQVSLSPPPPRVADGVLGRGPAPFHDEAWPHHLPHTGEAVGRGRSKADISHQMLSLLRRCSDIVANLTSSLGYVPYHPL